MTETATIAAHSGRNLRLYALCGVIAPIFFAVMVIIESLLQPGYSQVSQYISDLGAYTLYGPLAILQNLNFWVFGILVVAFALGGLRHTLPASRAVTTSLVFFGVMGFLAGVFPDQPSPWPGAVHGLVSIVAFFSVILCQFFVWRQLRRTSTREERGWGRYRAFSLTSGLLSLVLVVLAVILPHDISFGLGYFGVLQRLFLAVPLSWIEVMALRVFQLSKISVT